MGLKFEVPEVFAMVWIKVVCCLVTELKCYGEAWGATMCLMYATH